MNNTTTFKNSLEARLDWPANEYPQRKLGVITVGPIGSMVGKPAVVLKNYEAKPMIWFPLGEQWASDISGYRIRDLLPGEVLTIEGK